MIKRILIAGLPVLGIAGCSLAPKYERPEAPVSTAWNADPATDGSGANHARPGRTAAWALGWQEAFADEPRLQRVIGLALANNRDLRVALLNVERARARHRIQRATSWPQIDASGGAVRQHTAASVSPTGAATTGTQYSAGAGLTAFEIDLFGRVRNLNTRALEEYLATEEAQRGAHISLVSEVAIQYFTERALDEALDIAEQALKGAEASYALAVRKRELGASSELDLRSAESQVQAVRASLSDYRRQRAQAGNALVLLVGQALPADLPAPKPMKATTVLAEIPAGLPADLLMRRPDILQAEHALRAAHATIGAARAAFFPSITLTGYAGSVSPELSGLFGGGTGTWNFAPQVRLPLFAGGRNRANLDVAEFERQTEVARYEATIQSAFREVSDALVARATLTEQAAAVAARVSSEQRRLELAGLRYRQGMDNYLTVLAAQQDLFSAQQQLINVRLFRTSNLISLYRALGGGWYATTEEAG